MIVLPGYTLNSKLYESSASLVYRAVRDEDNRPVILKVLRSDYPSPQEIVRYRQEYELLHNLDLPGVIQAYEQIPYQHTYVIVCEDFGGESLQHWMRQWPQIYCPMQTPEFLKLAIQLTQALCQIHQRQIIHKDINPSNIVLNPATGDLKLIDFGIATQLAQTEQPPAPPTQLEGTLAYLSPEQTGRMNRIVDYRTDFYSLGVTFYQLLTGRLPFITDDLLELVHSHLAKLPVPPVDLNPKIPTVLSDLVLKLLAKDAEDRYQSTAGILADLESGLSAWQSTGHLAPFPLATQDFTGELQIPQKLYDRELEVARLLAAYERVAAGSGRGEEWPGGRVAQWPGESTAGISSHVELLLITGYSGIGKSALVRELYRPITERRGFFISGKFDQYQRQVPYSAIAAAFGELIRQLLGESEAALAEWCDRLLAAVGSNGQIIIDVLPEVERIIGPQPAVPQLGAIESQNRFNYVFQNFVRGFCAPEHPLTLFLDDLQWADNASLNLIQGLLTDSQTHHLLVLGAYRSNEVDAAHPLTLTLETLKAAGVMPQILALGPLTAMHVGQLLSDTLHQPVAAIADLTALVMQKTTGNPFFMSQFLKTLCDRHLLTFDADQRRWRWEMERIHAVGFTDNVAALMVESLKRQPRTTQKLLQLAACIGAEFDLETLAVVAEKPSAQLLTDLAIATQNSLIIPTAGEESRWQFTRYRFAHDQIQQAAYELISPEQRRVVHLQIGRLLWQETPPEQLSDRLFEITDHFNSGLLPEPTGSAAVSPAEQSQVAQLNLQAGQRAKVSLAYDAALTYLQVGLTLLGPHPWQTDYPLALTLHEEMAEAAYLSGNLAKMECCLTAVLAQAPTPLDTVRVSDIKIQALAKQGDLHGAIATGLDILSALGVYLPDQPSPADSQAAIEQIQRLLSARSLEALQQLPTASEAQVLAIDQLLAKIAAAAFISAPLLLPILLQRLIARSLQHGLTQASVVGYIGYALLCCGTLGQIETGYQLGLLSSQLVERLHARQVEPTVLNVLGGHIVFWKSPLQESLAILRRGYERGIETGDFEFAGYALHNLNEHAYFGGSPLAEVATTLQTNIQAFQQLDQNVARSWSASYLQAVRNLVSLDRCPTQLVGEVYDEEKDVAIAQAQDNRTALHLGWLNKLILCYLFGDYPAAIAAAHQAEQHLDTVVGMACTFAFCFYDALAQLALPPDQMDWERVNTRLAQLQHWAAHAPMNFGHKAQLVSAERARVQGQVLEAEDLYEEAIAGAQQHGYLQEAALAWELAGQFYRARGRDRIAATYLQEAHYTYRLWGATAKVKQLEEQYPEILAQSLQGETTGERTTQPSLASQSSPQVQIDLEAMMRASQTISSEIEMSRLLSTLMKTLIESAGARRGYLILPTMQANGTTAWVIEASGHLESSQAAAAHLSIAILQGLPLAGQLPVTLVNYVQRSQESLVLNDAAQSHQFTPDPYLQSHPTRSLLCAPLLNRGTLVGLIYLENDQITGAFTRDRLEMVKLLSGQAAISISNAKLYAQLQESETAIRRSEQRIQQFLDAMPIGVAVYEKSGRVTYQNPKAQELQGVNLPDDTDVNQLTEVFELYQADTQEPYPQAELPIARALQGETSQTDNLELRRADKALPLEVLATPILDELGEVQYAIAAFADITDRKRAQQLLTDYNHELEQQVEERTEALTQQWEMLQTLIDHIPVMLAFYGAEGELILVNQAIQATLGWSLIDLSLPAWLAKIYPDPEARQRALTHWEIADGTWWDSAVICRNGRLVETTWAHLQLRDGRKISIGQDITNRKQMERQLRSQAQAERLLADVTQQIRQSLNLTDILATTVSELQRTFQADRTVILKFCKEGGIRVIQATESERYQLPEFLSWVQDCELKDCYTDCLAGQPHIGTLHAPSGCLAPLLQTLGVQTEIVAPIIYPGNPHSAAEIWGLLMVHACETSREWQATEAQFLQRVSDQLAIAIYRSDLYFQLQSELQERRQTEAALRHSEARLTTAQAIARMGNWEIDVATQQMTWSKQLFDIAGMSPPTAPTFPDFVANLCHPEDRDLVERNVQLAIATGHPFQIIFRIRRPDGTQRYIESRGETSQNVQSEVIRVFGIAQDISERYEIDRMKDEFIGIVSHELRTPLTAIQSSLAMLTSGLFVDQPDQAASMLRIAHTNSDRLVRLVNDILNLERLESGKAQLQLESCAIDDLIKQAIESLQPLATQAHIQLHWEPCSAIVQADPDAILQTLTNLLSNAIKFSDPHQTVQFQAQIQNPKSKIQNSPPQSPSPFGATSLTGRLCHHPTTPSPHHPITPKPFGQASPTPSPPSTPPPIHSPTLLLSITDTGRGIPANKLQSIFNRFQQVDAVDSRQKGGTGLGLAICKNIVEQHGGEIWAESSVGVGSTFYFTLPLAAPEVNS